MVIMLSTSVTFLYCAHVRLLLNQSFLVKKYPDPGLEIELESRGTGGNSVTSLLCKSKDEAH